MNGFSSSTSEGCRSTHNSDDLASGCQYESSVASGAVFKAFGIGKCPRFSTLSTRAAVRKRLGFPCHPSPAGFVVHSAQTRGLAFWAAHGQNHGSGSNPSVPIEICARQPPSVALAQLAMRLPTARMEDVASGSPRTKFMSTDTFPRDMCTLVPPGGASELRSLTAKWLKPEPARPSSSPCALLRAADKLVLLDMGGK